LERACAGRLTSVYLEPLTPYSGEPHTSLVDALATYGPAKMVMLAPPFAAGAQAEIQAWAPDLAILGYTGRGIGAAEMAGLAGLDTFILNYEADAYPRLEADYSRAAAADLTIVASPSYFPAFAARGIEVGWWPGWCQDAYWQVERNVTGPDVAFIGALYAEDAFPGVGFRRKAVVAMAHSGLDFALYGPGWARAKLASRATTFGQYARNAQIYAGAKIGLSVDNQSVLYCACSDRPYNIAATGCLALVQAFPGMENHGFVDGETCAVFEDIGTMLDKARYYVTHDEEREAIGQRGRAMVRARHTWPARIEAL
jgi:hypothetical protein